MFATKQRPAVSKVEEKPAPKQAGFKLFSTKKAVPAPAPVAPAKTGFALFGAKKAAAPAPAPVAPAKTGFTLFGAKKAAAPAAASKKVDKAGEYRKRESALSAFDFSAARSRSDAELLYDARYGKLEGGKMSPEQYQALRRKVGGTAKDFWKTSIDVVGEYTDKGYIAKEPTASNVPALPFLVGTVVALFGTVGYVVAQTSQ